MLILGVWQTCIWSAWPTIYIVKLAVILFWGDTSQRSFLFIYETNSSRMHYTYWWRYSLYLHHFKSSKLLNCKTRGTEQLHVCIKNEHTTNFYRRVCHKLPRIKTQRKWHCWFDWSNWCNMQTHWDDWSFCRERRNHREIKISIKWRRNRDLISQVIIVRNIRQTRVC